MISYFCTNPWFFKLFLIDSWYINVILQLGNGKLHSRNIWTFTLRRVHPLWRHPFYCRRVVVPITVEETDARCTPDTFPLIFSSGRGSTKISSGVFTERGAPLFQRNGVHNRRRLIPQNWKKFEKLGKGQRRERAVESRWFTRFSFASISEHV